MMGIQIQRIETMMKMENRPFNEVDKQIEDYISCHEVKRRIRASGLEGHSR